MGYTHTFEITKKPGQEQWAGLMLDVQKLFKTLPTCQELMNLGVDAVDEIVLRGPMGDKKSICNTRKISFNGDSINDLYCESFMLLPKRMSDFCKTDRKPYDFAVCAVLILAYNHLPDIVLVTSDGDAYDWDPALNWVRHNIWPGALLPPGIKSAVLPSDSGLLERPEKVLKRFLDNLKDTESAIGGLLFSLIDVAAYYPMGKRFPCGSCFPYDLSITI